MKIRQVDGYFLTVRAHGMCTGYCRGMVRGSVRRRNDRWGFRVDVGLDPVSGRRLQVSRQGFATKREAESALNGIMAGLAARPSGIVMLSVRSLLEEWLKRLSGGVQASTLHGYRLAADPVIASLGDTHPATLSTAQLQRFESKLLTSGGHGGGRLAPKTVSNVHAVPHKAFDDAMRLGVLEHNPMASVVAPELSIPPLRCGRLRSSARFSARPLDIGCTPLSSFLARPGCAAARCSGSNGATLTWRTGRSSSNGPSRQWTARAS